MKFPIPVGGRFFFRFLIPGFLLAFVFKAVVHANLYNKLDYAGDLAVTQIILTLIFGWFITLLDSEIYMLYEGRRYWPRWLYKIFFQQEEKRLKKILYLIKTSKQTAEHEVDLKHFPYNAEKGNHVVRPTRLGNLITAFERYPQVSYQMHGGAYWYRIWLSLPQELRIELDEQQAIADGSVYLSFCGLIIGPILTVVKLFEQVFNLPILSINWQQVAVASLIGVVIGFFLYRTSISAYGRYGEYFKAMFDQFHTAIDVTPILKHLATILEDPNFEFRHRGFSRFRVAQDYLRWREAQRKDGTWVNVDKTK